MSLGINLRQVGSTSTSVRTMGTTVFVILMYRVYRSEKEQILNAYFERPSMHQWAGRYTRKTLSFSKSEAFSYWVTHLLTPN